MVRDEDRDDDEDGAQSGHARLEPSQGRLSRLERVKRASGMGKGKESCVITIIMFEIILVTQRSTLKLTCALAGKLAEIEL